MPEPAGPDELSELRELIVGPELVRLGKIETRVADRASRTADLSEVLADGIRGAKAQALGEALGPVFEKAFTASVRRKPKELADAIYPVIGPSIRTSIAAAVRDFAEGLNQIVEKSASFRAISWRIESIISGKPFSEILLARSLLYSVEQVFLIHRKSGLLLQHVAAKDAVLKDADMISGMLTAVQDFFSDSFTEDGQNLETIDAGRFKLWLTYSPKVIVLGAVSGTAPVELRQVFRKALDQIEVELAGPIATFRQGDVSIFEPACPILEACLLGQAAPRNRKQAKLWPYLVGVAVVVLALFGWHLYSEARWNRYFDSLRQQPGIVVTGVEKGSLWRDPAWIVTGVKDPLAKLPEAKEIDQRKVRYVWQEWLSLNTTFATQRDLDAAVTRIRVQIIRFDTNSSKLVIAEADRIDDLTRSIGDVLRLRPQAKIALIGHADEVGNPEINVKLSQDRAYSVQSALIAQGIPATALTTVPAGNTKPVRPGSTDWDLAANRSVSFEVTLP